MTARVFRRFGYVCAAGCYVACGGAPSAPPPKTRAEVSRETFVEASKVFLHPRCVNCHPAGDAPLQGDDSHRHAQSVVRGPDGHGVLTMKCPTCHGAKNFPQENAPPGATDWHLPPPETPMVFEGRTAAQLCVQLKDGKQNGGRDVAQVIDHVQTAPLTSWAWAPGLGRTPAPGTQAQLVALLRRWADTGAECP